MKKYIGTQQVEAKSMTMGEAYKRNLLQKGKVPNDSEKDNSGFYVRCQDGCENWLPAETFCKIYKIADTPLEKMIIEHQELRDKINKLKEIRCRKEFCDFDYKQRILLKMQLRSMTEYSLILKERIENM